jgi:hypothetical protein
VQRPDTNDGIAAVEVFGHLIGLEIDEFLRNVPHVLTRAEAREKALGRGWSIPEHDSVPSGELAIVLDHSVDGERRSFSGGKEREIESTLPGVVKALVRIAMRLRAEQNRRADALRREQEAAEKRQQEEQRRREEAARIAAERRRRRELLHAAAKFRQVRGLIDMIAAVEVAATSQRVDADALSAWAAYAKGIADSIDPVSKLAIALRSDHETQEE